MTPFMAKLGTNDVLVLGFVRKLDGKIYAIILEEGGYITSCRASSLRVERISGQWPIDAVALLAERETVTA